MPDWDDVVRIGLALPGVEVGTSFRTPALRVRGKGMCRMRTNPDALVLRVSDMGEREALLQGQPDVFFTTPHYDGYPYVLVRLEAIDPVERTASGVLGSEISAEVNAILGIRQGYRPGRRASRVPRPVGVLIVADFH